MLRAHAACFYPGKSPGLPPRVVGADPEPLCWPGPPQKCGTGAALLCPALCDRSCLWGLVMSSAGFVHRWREQQGCKELLEDLFSFVFIQVEVHKSLSCSCGTQLANFKLPALCKMIEGCPELNLCSKIISLLLTALYIYAHTHTMF